MGIRTRALRAGLGAASVVAPPLAAEIGFRLWRRIGQPEPVHARDADVHLRARRDVLDLDGRPVATYTWGEGPHVVLLVHGWQSRASRFSALVRALESPERTLVAFDAPGNGASPGRRVTLFDYVRIIRLLAARHGGVDAIVAHSFGVLASFIAVREGVRVDRLVGVAGMHDADQIVDQFSREAGLGGRAQRGLRRRIERRFFPDVPDFWRRSVAELDPADTGTAVLLVHDRDDARVSVAEATRIAEAHTGAVRVELTSGLGHNRILGAPAVTALVAGFLSDPTGAVPPHPAESRTP